jgi:5'(3')-deoxyribonucleotidase
VKIRVGIDVDETLRAFIEQIANLAEQETGVRPSYPQKYYYDIEKETGISFRKRIWQTGEWTKPVFEDAPVLPFAKEGYEKFIADDRFIVYIVTHQSKGTEKHTSEWLRKNGFTGYEDIYFTGKKTEAPAQILIDDKPSYLEDYRKSMRDTVIIDKPYNQEFKTNQRVNNLLEAYNLLKEKYGTK